MILTGYEWKRSLRYAGRGKIFKDIVHNRVRRKRDDAETYDCT